MRKIIFLILVFTFIISLSFAGDLENVHGRMSFGYVQEIQAFKTNVEVGYKFWRFDFYGGIETLMLQREKFNPYQDIYFVGLNFDISKYIFLNVNHLCRHGVYSPASKEKFEKDSYEMSEIMIGIDF